MTAAQDIVHAWLDYLKPFSTGLVVSSQALRELGLDPIPQRADDTAEAEALIDEDVEKPALPDAWAFLTGMLRWEAKNVAGSPGGPAVPDALVLRLPEHTTTLQPTFAVKELGSTNTWQLLVRVEAAGIDPDARGALPGWEATAHQRLERLLRETGIPAGLLVTDHMIRLIHAPKGETSGWLGWPIRPLSTVAGRPMLAGLKLLLDRARLFNDAESRRLPALLRQSREAQASVSTELAGQVLGALHELLRGLDGAAPDLVRSLAQDRPGHLYEGLLTVLMRLVFILYAEDRDLLPSRADAPAKDLYERSYSARGLYAQLVEDEALNPDTMEDRRGGWGRLLALFRMIHAGHGSGFVRGRGGKLFDPDAFPFLEGRADVSATPSVLPISDACVLRILEGLMTLQARGRGRERISYRALDVEQIGSVYETVMGFKAEPASGPMLAIKAGKNNRVPVFVDLTKLAAAKGKDRLKHLKEEADRTLSEKMEKAVAAANSVTDLAAALDGIVDLRGSPRGVVSPGTPILQPTDERRRTGSHYTPRSLTEPIVRHALEPVFDRLGKEAKPEEVLALKVCDPAMGSGAFLVEACRQIGARLVNAWAQHKATPQLPPDEDEELHARRLVAQRCLYGVDKNPRAVDLACLSLWLATLARDHEFSFLDHALKCGDSLVGLDRGQIAAMHWDVGKAGLPLFRRFVADRVAEATEARIEIQSAPDDTQRAILEQKHREVEDRVALVRVLGDAVLSAFFCEDKPKAREKSRATIESWVAGDPVRWNELRAAAASLTDVAHPLVPFHWQIEFPEVFARDNGGFDAIVGNPPFAGKNTIIAGSVKNYLPWLQTLHEGAHGNADLVAHFFRRAFGLLRQGGVFGLIATNTIGQGDTRASGLTRIIADGGAISRATRRLKWPGEAAVVVSVVHIVKGEAASPVLDTKAVRRISAYLVEGDLDTSPVALAANSDKAFVGSYVLGMGFTFDDAAASKGEAESLETMRALIAKDPKNGERIFPYLGGEDVNSSPTHEHKRHVIDFADFPLRREVLAKTWMELSVREREECLRIGIVPADYPEPVAADWPDLLQIVEKRAKPQRLKQKDKIGQQEWWRFLRRRDALYAAINPLERVMLTPRVSSSPNFATVPNGFVFNEKTIVFSFSALGSFACLQARTHEVWLRAFTSTLKDDLNYAPSDCFGNFPFPASLETDPALDAAGEAYHSFRAQLMIARNEGLTKTYNRFHARGENGADVARLRALHCEMDVAVLRAYGWNDLADGAAPEFIEQEADEGKTPKTRLDWPSDFKGEVLARLLALNAERAAEERALGLVPAAEDDDTTDEDEAA